MMGRLTTFGVKAATKPGRYTDGDGLSLVVTAERRAWVLRVQQGDRRREFGLGSAERVTLAAARARAAELRQQVKQGVDPSDAKRAAAAERAKVEAERARAKAEIEERTFIKAAHRLHGLLSAKFRNPKHSAQWLATLRAHAFPAFGDKPVATITGAMVVDALEPIWRKTPETARRVCQRIAAVLEAANAWEWRDPAPDLKRLANKGLGDHADTKGHHAAVDYVDAAAVLAKLRASPESVGRLALIFTIYTAARSGETRGMTWGEVDTASALWTIPAARMKAGREHIVPLSAPALAILDMMAKARRTNDLGELIFPGAKAGRPLSDMTMAKAQGLLAPGTTVHGWRSTFRDWAGETTAFPSDVLEACLAHVVGNKVQRSYQRGTMLDKRRDVMDAWAAYLAPVAADNVVTLATRRRA